MQFNFFIIIINCITQYSSTTKHCCLRLDLTKSKEHSQIMEIKTERDRQSKKKY